VESFTGDWIHISVVRDGHTRIAQNLKDLTSMNMRRELMLVLNYQRTPFWYPRGYRTGLENQQNRPHIFIFFSLKLLFIFLFVKIL
jgi:hypothetical protein